MSQFISTLNLLRNHADETWLTPSQTEVYHRLRDRLEAASYINLWGVPGTGKTFLAWVAVRSGWADYMPNSSYVKLASKSSVLIVDNVSWQRQKVRAILNDCDLAGYHKIVLLSAEPINDQMPILNLSLQPGDFEKVITNLKAIRIMPRSTVPRSLWDLVIPISL
jgi:hypothetical protein